MSLSRNTHQQLVLWRKMTIRTYYAIPEIKSNFYLPVCNWMVTNSSQLGCQDCCHLFRSGYAMVVAPYLIFAPLI